MPSPDILRPDSETGILYRAELLQRMGLTLTEIADRLNIDRSAVVGALYTDKVRDRVPVPEIEPPKAPYAGHEKRLRLRAPNGQWLHHSADRMTLVKADAWIGTPADLYALRKSKPDLLNALTVNQA